MTAVRDCLVIMWRDIIRNLRQKSPFFTALIRPLLWLFLLGTGLRSGFIGLPVGFNLQQYTFPGIIAMNILFSGVMSGASIIWDREFGFLKEVMVAPVSRLAITMGKVLSGSIIATFHGVIVLAFYPLLNIRLNGLQLVLILMAIFFIAVAVTSLGVLLASRLRSIEGFGTINNFLVMPLFFLSGAMYPTNTIPLWLKYLVYFNPLTYGVNLLRGIILKVDGFLLLNLGEIALFTILALITAVFFFERDESKH